MSHLVIEYRGFARRLRLTSDEELEPDDEAPRESSPLYKFFVDFYKAGAEYQAPQRTATSEDFNIIRQLLTKYDDRATLLEWARLFWRGHADAVYDHTDAHVLRLFRSKIPDIIREG